MEINVANQRILMFDDQISFGEAEEKAWAKKMVAFDTFSKLGSFLSKPKEDDFELIYKEHRFEPFWHLIAKAHYKYERNSNYQIKVKGKEVYKVTALKIDFVVTNEHIHLPVLEHCTQDESEEVLIDGLTGKNKPEFKDYFSLSPKQVDANSNQVSTKAKTDILVPPQARISAIMRDSLSKLIKGIEADKIIEEQVSIDCVDLYYHPIYAFKFLWKSKNKEAIVEIDGLTKEVKSGVRVFNEYFGKLLDKNFLFDLGADAAGILIPGGSIAVKLAKKYVDTKRK